MRAAFEMGANFVLDKPLTMDRMGKSVRVARGMMIQERRRYFRQPVDFAVWLTVGREKPEKVTATNLSEGGMCVQLRRPLELGTVLDVDFTLPESDIRVETRAQLAWTDGQGRAGLRFDKIPFRVRGGFEKWLGDRIAQEEQYLEKSQETRSYRTLETQPGVA
jgi:hypothetical protein